ncbi:cysteine-rich repeat secretory protein 38-like isoform X1 [Pistacia vera]|uniref:cysteine-rich repeat secretory protein 38-like isoform X1 n=1 Tax=Pistacia vera TaxID=55513 RepID=UPI001262D476|nr:cysteine-rich repeat secretory protein 38-like isoform X1 [Pistacia vera]
MASLGVLLLAVTVALHLVALTINAKQEILQHFCLSEPGNFSENSAYKSNLNRLLSSLSSNTKINYGFYIASSGQDPDIVRGMALCRGDVKPDICRGCINDSSLELSKLCPNQKEAVIWYDYCMLRYSNRYIFGSMEFGPYFWVYNTNNVSNWCQFNNVSRTLLDRLIKKAASGGCHRKFARGNRTTPSCQTIYALVQCTPDLSEQQCIDCLNNATALIPTACAGKQGCRVIAPSCNFRYEKDFIFYDTTANHQGHGHLNCRQNKN